MLAMPPILTDRLAGKRFALIDFSLEQQSSISNALTQSHGFCRAFGREALGRNELGTFDVILLRAGVPLDIAAASVLIEIGKPVLLVGPRDVVYQRVAGLGEIAQDFLIEPWDAEDLLLRCVHVLSLAERGVRPARPRDADSHPTVIVADDDASTRAIVQRVLKNSGFVCHAAGDGSEALEMTRTLHPDVVILDVNMPALDGFEVLSRIKDNPDTKAIPVLLLTSRQQETDVLRGFALEAADYVIKPFNPMELTARVSRLIRNSL